MNTNVYKFKIILKVGIVVKKLRLPICLPAIVIPGVTCRFFDQGCQGNHRYPNGQVLHVDVIAIQLG